MTSFIYQSSDGGDRHGTHCKCCRFTRGIDLPSPRNLAVTEIKIEARNYSARILHHWSLLNACLKRFEAVIQKRWLKKTARQRQEILLRAWPEISRIHRPDFMGAHNRGKKSTLSRTRRSQAFLWPYINVQDLLQDHLLPLFLGSRGRHFPELFIDADLENAHRGHGWPKEVELRKTAMVFAGGRSPSRYGRLIVNKDPADKHITKAKYQPIVGLFILEVQDGIYSFLLECCKAILHDVNSVDWFVAPSRAAPPPPSPGRRSSLWPSTPSIALEAPYRVPQQFDLDRFKSMVGAKRSAARDHLWLLREDPGYFLDTWVELKHHDLEFYDNKLPENHMWKHVAGKMLSDAFCNFWLWDELGKVLGHMVPIEDQLCSANHRTGRLRGADEELWAWLDAVVNALSWIPRESLERGVPVSPKIQIASDINIEEEGATQAWAAKPGCSDAEYRVHVLFFAMFNEEQSKLHGIQHIVQEIQNMMDTDPEACGLIDSWVSSRFSDFALLSELQRSIMTFQPWARGWRLNDVADSFIVKRMIGNALSRDMGHCKTLKHVMCMAKAPIGVPSDGRLYYPADKKPTKESTQQMRMAEEHLAKVWSSVSNHFKDVTGIPLWHYFFKLAGKTKRTSSTPPWVDPHDDTSSNPVTDRHVLQECDIDVRSRNEIENRKSEIVNSAKTKVKTRGRSSEEYAVMTPEAQSDNMDVPSARRLQSSTSVPVSKRAFCVLSALLPLPHALAHTRKEVSWDDLLAALHHIGLHPQKLYGSVWVFRPAPSAECKVPMTRSIQFHEPKEVRRGSKIPPHMVRTFGRRLKYAYGWSDGMFVCE